MYVFGSLSLTHSSLIGICSVGSNRSLHNLFILHSSRQIWPLFCVPVTERPANVVADAGQELPDCPAASDKILA